MKVRFDATEEEARLVGEIASRANKMQKLDCLSLQMDLIATHANGNPMDFQKLLDADDFNFAHDVWGIMGHINRKTGKLMGFFIPRCSARKTTQEANP